MRGRSNNHKIVTISQVYIFKLALQSLLLKLPNVLRSGYFSQQFVPVLVRPASNRDDGVFMEPILTVSRGI